MQEVCDGVVSHVYRRVTQALYEEVVVPWKLRTQTICASAGPLVQPCEDALESISSFRVVGLHLRHKPDRRQ